VEKKRVSEEEDPVKELAALLARIDARPVLVRERMAASTLYDADYHLAVVACAFTTHAKPDASGRNQILASWLKLLQFVAARPRLVPDLQVWAQTRRKADLETWRKMPRGYVGDLMHDGIIEFLIAAGVLERDKDRLVGGTRVEMLEHLYEQLEAANLFATERRVLDELLTIRPYKTMLGGA
jgi:hypothetical protein